MTIHFITPSDTLTVVSVYIGAHIHAHAHHTHTHTRTHTRTHAHKGYHGDCSEMFTVGEVDERGQELLQVSSSEAAGVLVTWFEGGKEGQELLQAVSSSKAAGVSLDITTIVLISCFVVGVCSFPPPQGDI